jgi:hypothetical protein|tara:strand:+ start:247 stop:660 length:414 start_codon:yes stop_codon:yes gene_type:complete
MEIKNAWATEDEPKKYSEKQEKFLEALCSEARGNIRQAMTIAGYSVTTSINSVVKPLKEEIIERSQMLLAMNTPKATLGLIGVLDDPESMGARNTVAAASQILDRTGIIKKEQIEVKSDKGGLFILPPKKADATLTE